MNTTVVVDGELLNKAREYSSLQENSELVQEALRVFIRREAARRLAELGGTMPDAEAPPRRRWDP
ncbi:Arc/MetJ family transcription regulator [Nitrobacteraceae bacterium AZCC 2161]